MDGLWVFLAVVCGMGIYYEHLNKKLKYKSRSQLSDDAQKQIDQLTQRVEALETLVTDKSYQVRREIDSL